MFNRVVLTLKIIIAVCGVGLLASAHANEGAPVATVEIDSYDFGTEFQGIDVIHDFIIKNTGHADLEIQKVKSG